MLEHPLGVFEVGGRLGPVLVVGAEPSGPLALVLAGEELGELGGPDVGVFAGRGMLGSPGGMLCGGRELRSSVRVELSVWSTGCCHQFGRGLSWSRPVSAVFSWVVWPLLGCGFKDLAPAFGRGWGLCPLPRSAWSILYFYCSS